MEKRERERVNEGVRKNRFNTLINIFYSGLSSSLENILIMTQSAGAAEYSDCTSAEE